MKTGLNERFSEILKEYFDDDNLKPVESLNDQLVEYGFPEIKEDKFAVDVSKRTLISTFVITKELNDFNTTFYYFKNRKIKGEATEYDVEIMVKFREGSKISKEIGSIIIKSDGTIEFYDSTI